jgi:hypothetical protein
VKLALIALALTGCDAGVDAPDICDTPAIACTASTGRTVCGQLTIASTGEPYRVASPRGVPCSGTEGPCGLTIFGQPLATYFQGSTTNRIMGQTDDCGHYVIPDVDSGAMDIAVIATGANIRTSGRLVFDATATTVDRVTTPIVLVDTVTAWAGQLGVAESAIAQGYLVRYLDGVGAPVAMEEVRVAGAAVGAPGTPPTPPWAAYVSSSGTGPFETLDKALTATTALGTVLIAAPSGTFRIGGFHVGKQCGRDGFQAVSNTFLTVVLGGTPPGC